MSRGTHMVIQDCIPLAADAAHFNAANIGKMVVELVAGASSNGNTNPQTVRRLRGHATETYKVHGLYVGRSTDGSLVSIAVSGWKMRFPRETTAAAITEEQMGLTIINGLAANPGTVRAAEASTANKGRASTEIIGGNSETGTAASPAYFDVNFR